VTILALSLGGLPFTGGALAKYAVKGPLGEGLAGALANVSAAGTTLLMLHFVHRLRRNGAADPVARAPGGLVLPWALIAVACVAVPWGMYLSLPTGTVENPLAPGALWDALRPVLAGAAIAFALDRWGGRLPRIPLGDVAVAIDAAVRAAPAWGRAFDRIDGALRAWPAAALALAALTVAFGLALAR
jgi:multicomponent Na+:H+ antiporter subunit A